MEDLTKNISPLREIFIPNYPSKIKVSDKRRATYYREGKKIPKRCQNENYTFKDGVLVHAETGEKVIKNSRSVGTPKFWSVNFQAIWNQQIKYQDRANVTKKLKDFFRPYVEVLEPINEYPIRIEMFLFDQNMPVDVDNKGVIFTKVITDLLVNTNKDEVNNKKIIEDDSSEYINDIGRCKWIKIKEEEQPKMIIRIWKSNNELM
jgi:hypothetical protein